MPEGISKKLSLGNIGVDIFFVISGFLITDIILSYKEQGNIIKSLKIFYVRRTLRIFPLYYFYIFIVILLYFSELNKKEVIYAISYCYNFFIISNQGFGNFLFPHLWSLSVEEQFYLFWPLLLFIIPKNLVTRFITILIFFSILFSLINTFYFHVMFVEYVHTMSCTQALAFGGLLAAILKYNDKNKFVQVIGRHSLLFFTLGLFGWILSFAFHTSHPFTFAFMRSFGSFMAFVLLIKLVLPASHEISEKSFLYRLMEISLLQFIGRISYGIYIYHLLVRHIVDVYIRGFFKNYHWFYVHFSICTFPIYMSVTVIISYVSFRFLESPLNSLKKRYSM